MCSRVFANALRLDVLFFFHSLERICNHRNVILSICLLFYDEALINKYKENTTTRRTKERYSALSIIFSQFHIAIAKWISLFSTKARTMDEASYQSAKKKLLFGLHLFVSNGEKRIVWRNHHTNFEYAYRKCGSNVFFSFLSYLCLLVSTSPSECVKIKCENVVVLFLGKQCMHSKCFWSAFLLLSLFFFSSLLLSFDVCLDLDRFTLSFLSLSVSKWLPIP